MQPFAYVNSNHLIDIRDIRVALDELCAPCEVGLHPSRDWQVKAKISGQAFEKDFVVNAVERCTNADLTLRQAIYSRHPHRLTDPIES